MEGEIIDLNRANMLHGEIISVRACGRTHAHTLAHSPHTGMDGLGGARENTKPFHTQGHTRRAGSVSSWEHHGKYRLHGVHMEAHSSPPHLE